MFKFTCLVLCAIAVNFNGVYAMGAVEMILFDCAKEYGLTQNALQVVVTAKDVAKIDPCYWGCALKKTKFMNEKGEFDAETGMTFLEKNILDLNGKQENGMLREIATNCKPVNDKAVSDGKAGCERGALVAVCVMEQLETQKKQIAP